MKYKILSIIGIAVAILMTLAEGVLVFYNLGCPEINLGGHTVERMPFSWGAIKTLDWILLAIVMVWYSLLIIPWIQYFIGIYKKNSFIPTLTGGGSIASVGYTISNIAMIVGASVWFIHTGEPDELGYYLDFDSWWRDLLMIFMFFVSFFYVPLSITVIVRKHRWDREIVKPEHIWYWFVTAIPFLLMAFLVFDAWR